MSTLSLRQVTLESSSVTHRPVLVMYWAWYWLRPAHTIATCGSNLGAASPVDTPLCKEHKRHCYPHIIT
ncbi:hypothetical protein E2C01_038351 [Portunus trituberculatus]|uniref:Uncharacterized protein n=1 Tax=Portunus trituberculatus TaxID=210409 RepID=A0A5B7FDY6_PORTR|nr:hypothetical protein [Portunus trituberculatus]